MLKFLALLPLQVILGDNAYPASPTVLKIYEDRVQWDQDTRRKRRCFNCLMSGTRVVVEQALGTLKQRFRRLLVPLPFALPQSRAVILACIILHNFVVRTGGGFLQVPDPVDMAAEEDGDLVGEVAPP